MRRPALAIALLFLGITVTRAQTIAPLTERIEVSITNVDVMVTDRAGHPITGLTMDDFEIFEEGVLQKITNFYTIENAAVRMSRPQKNGTEEAGDLQQFRRKVVLMIDNNFIEKPQRDAALNQLDEFIDKNFGGNYEWSVITIGRRVQTVQTFTTDKQQIHAALDQVRLTGTVNFQAEQDRALLSDSTRRATMADAASNYGYQSSVRFRGREQTMRNLLATTNTARAVIQTCRAFAAAEGKKLVVLVTAGMERKTSFDAYDLGTRDRKLEDMKLDVGRALDEMVHEANAANFNLYVVKARGRGMIAPQHDVENKSSGLNLQSTNIFQQGGGGGPIDTTDVDSSSLTLALGTGGLYLTSSNTASNFEKIDTDSSNYYSLGYSPHRPEDGEYHHINVKVKRPGLVVRHREGYVNVSFEERLEESLLSPLAFPKEKGSLPVTLDVGKPTDTDRVMVPMTAEMPLSRLTMLPREDGYIGRVHVYLSIYDAEGNNVGYHHLIRDVNIPAADQARVKNALFRYKMNVALRKGDFTFLVTLRDDVSNEIGTATQNVRL